MKWYAIQVYSGFEKSVKRSLVERIGRSNFADQFGEILIPIEEVIDNKNGKKRIVEHKLYPGYVFLELILTDDSWHLVKNTPKVSGFLGGNKPTPFDPAQIENIKKQMQEGAERPRPKVAFEVGEQIRVIEGPFKDFNGVVDEVNYDKNKLRVSVSIFGRATPVELDFSGVEKV